MMMMIFGARLILFRHFFRRSRQRLLDEVIFRILYNYNT